MRGADNCINVHHGAAPGVSGHDDVPVVLGVDVKFEARGLVIVQEEGRAVLAGAASETYGRSIFCVAKV